MLRTAGAGKPEEEMSPQAQHMKKENKTGRKWRKVLLAVIIILLAAGLIFRFFVYDKLVDKAADHVVSSAMASQGYTQEQVSKALDSLDTADRTTVQNIIKNHDDPATIKEAADYAQTGNKEALKELADEKLTAQEKAELKEIYEKYVNQQNAESGQTA